MIICSDLPAGKPLHMHARTTDVHLHICQHPCQTPKYYKSSKPLCLFPNPNFMPVTYLQYNRHQKNYHSLGISAVNKYGKNPCMIEERDTLELDFGQTLDILQEEYLDVYEGIQSEILNTTKFYENKDPSTTNLGKPDRSKNDKIKAGVLPHIRTRV